MKIYQELEQTQLVGLLCVKKSDNTVAKIVGIASNSQGLANLAIRERDMLKQLSLVEFLNEWDIPGVVIRDE